MPSTRSNVVSRHAIVFRLPDEVLKKVDTARGLIPRNAWLLSVVEAHLSHLQARKGKPSSAAEATSGQGFPPCPGRGSASVEPTSNTDKSLSDHEWEQRYDY